MSRDTNAVLLLAEYFLWLVRVMSLSRDSIINRSRDTNTALQLVGMLSRDTDLVLSLAVRSPVPAPKHHCSRFTSETASCLCCCSVLVYTGDGLLSRPCLEPFLIFSAALFEWSAHYNICF